jgi:carboxymethylenebutenolidase
MIGQDLTIPVGGVQMPAYLTRPQEASGPHPAVVVLGEVFGFTPETRRVTDLLPTIGYVGLAINYFHRIDPAMNQPYTEEGNRNAFAAAKAVTREHFVEDAAAAVRWLAAQPFVRDAEVAVWGTGFGAIGAIYAASLPEVKGAVAFYPSDVEQPIEHAAGVRAPLLIIFGEQDYYVSRHGIVRLAEALRSAGKDFKLQTYPNVGHSFFRHGRPQAIAQQWRCSDEAVATAVADAWDVVRVFLRDVFNPKRSRASESGDIRTRHTQSAQS